MYAIRSYYAFLNRKLDTAINVAPMLQALEATYAFPVSRNNFV